MRLIDADTICDGMAEGWQAALVRAQAAERPAVDPVKHGRWVNNGEDDEWKCSECGEEQCCFDMTPEEFGLHYCPNCGARMDGGN